jgi:two-component system, NarL family, response regulator NreC
MIRILLADDHTLFRRGLRHILEEHDQFSVVAEATSGLEAVELARQFKPDVAVVDIGMKELNGVEATAQLMRESRKTAVLILSMHSDERYVTRAIKAGARGYMLKDAVEEGLIGAIHLLHKGGSYFTPAFVKSLEERKSMGLGSLDIEDRYELLSERERQLYHLLAEGKANKEIAARLHLSLHTVETHRTRIMEKLGVHGIAELVISAVRRGDLLPE